MTYNSVDQLQKTLTENVFNYTKDSKKAAGRALGTIVEIITFYFLKTWGLNNAISIERKIPEYGNSEITHNVEYSLHPILKEYQIEVKKNNSSITSHKILKLIEDQLQYDVSNFLKTKNNLLSKDDILRNACTIAINNKDKLYLIASLKETKEDKFIISIVEQSQNPYAIFECKRVGVEEGNKKGPQTIEKAKQGAYVARAISSLQKVRMDNGDLYGIIFQNQKIVESKPYHNLLQEIINSDNYSFLENFILTVGIVSNHGNWFTSENQNKELQVLAQSYDWLLFLSDSGMTELIEEVIFNPLPEYQSIKDAFLISYSANKNKNQFTKVNIKRMADVSLRLYFSKNINKIEKWFNIISPKAYNLKDLQKEISKLHNKRWSNMLK